MATKRLYVGNLNYEATEQDLRDFFSNYTLSDVKIVTDRDSGRPRGFGFVELADGSKMAAAIEELNQTQMMGRTITINEAREREGGGRGRSGGGGGRGDRGRRERDY